MEALIAASTRSKKASSWWDLTVTIVLLTICLVIIASIGLLLLFSSAFLQEHVHGSAFFLRALEWITVAVCLYFAFALLYRFAPNVPRHAVRWSTPGALCALLLWLASTFAAHIYFDHINDYTRSYGPLNRVVMLLLWLYASNGALLIGGEMNSEIQKAESGPRLGSQRSLARPPAAEGKTTFAAAHKHPLKTKPPPNFTPGGELVR